MFASAIAAAKPAFKPCLPLDQELWLPQEEGPIAQIHSY
jgi:hypothetical protein